MNLTNPMFPPDQLTERVYIPDGPATPAARALSRKSFQEIDALIRDILQKDSHLEPDMLARVSMEAIARARDYLVDEGIAISIFYLGTNRSAMIVLRGKGPSTLNTFAKDVFDKYSHLRFAYQPIEQIRNNFGAMFNHDGRLLTVSGALLLSPTLKNWLMLHEFRHAKNRERRKKGLPYGLYGNSMVVKGRLPGLRDLYESYLSHDEIHTYFESLKQVLIHTIHETRSADGKRAGDALIRVLALSQQAYRISHRLEKIAEMILDQNQQKEITFVRAADGVVEAHIRMKFEDNEFVTNLPLVGIDPNAPIADKTRAMVIQALWLKDAAGSSKNQFDLALQVASKIQNIIDNDTRLAGLLALQSVLRPIDFNVFGQDPITLIELVNAYNAAVNASP